jgi:iron complex outermembrane receptor protein
MTKKIILFLLIVLSGKVMGQSISGRVMAESSGLDGVNIKIINLEHDLITTGLDGSFIIEGLSAEKYELEFTRVGFVSLRETVDLRKKKDVVLTIQLEPDPMLFEEVAVIGEKVGLTEKTPYNISRLDAKNVALKGQPSGVMGLIQQEPGVNGAEMGHGIVKPFIRGLGFSRVVTIYQGGKLENHQWGADHGLGLNDLGIASVDVIKGPASILYGSGAIGGVLLLNDDEFYAIDNTVRGMFGTSLNTVSGGIRGYGTIGTKLSNGIFFAAEGAYENHADYFDGDNRLIGNSRFSISTGRFHLGYKGEKFQNKLSYAFNEQFLGIIEEDEMEEGESLTTNRSDREMQLPFQRVEDHLISYRQEYRFNESWRKEMDLTYHYNQREEIEDDFDEIDLGLQQHHMFYNLRFHHKLNENYTHTFGLQGSYIDMRNMLVAEEILFPNAQYLENGLYYLGTYSKSRHTFQGGIRADYRPLFADANQENIVEEGYTLPGNPADRTLNLDFFGVTGSLGYAFEVNEKNVFKINASSGFRSPDLAELLSNGPHPGTNRFEVGNVNFGNEQSFQGDVSWLYGSKKLNVQASIFGNYVNNYIFFVDGGDTTDSGLNIWEFRQTDALLYGAELNLTYKPFESNKLKIDVFGNIIRGQDLVNEDHLTFIPADRVGTQITFQPLKQSTFEIFARNQYIFRQNRPGFGEEQTRGYNLLDFGMNYKVKLGDHRLNIGLTAFNLLNQTYFDHISILRAFKITAPGRNLMLNVQWRF